MNLCGARILLAKLSVQIHTELSNSDCVHITWLTQISGTLLILWAVVWWTPFVRIVFLNIQNKIHKNTKEIIWKLISKTIDPNSWADKIILALLARLGQTVWSCCFSRPKMANSGHFHIIQPDFTTTSAIWIHIVRKCLKLLFFLFLNVDLPDGLHVIRSGYIFLAGILYKWCCVLLSESHQEVVRLSWIVPI